jgi:cell division protein FtsB
VEDLKVRVEELSQEMTKITQSPQYAQKILRDRFNLTSEGETLMFFEDE